MSDAVAGHHFCHNGDLLVSYHAGAFLVHELIGFREGVKLVLERWASRRCQACGCPEARYHAASCGRRGLR